MLTSTAYFPVKLATRGTGGRRLRRKGQPRLAIGTEGVEKVRQGRNNVLVIIGAALLLAGLLLYALDSPGWLIGGLPLAPLLLAVPGTWLVLRVLLDLRQDK